MKHIAIVFLASALGGCAIPTTGVVPRAEGMHTVTRQGGSFMVQPMSLTAEATQEAEAYCARSGKRIKVVHVKEIQAGALGRWPESEVLFRCE